MFEEQNSYCSSFLFAYYLLIFLWIGNFLKRKGNAKCNKNREKGIKFPFAF
jgi:hypothetical protein